LGVAVFLHQSGVAKGGLHWVEIFALEIFNEGEFELVGWGELLPENDRDFFQACEACCSEAALSSDENEIAVAVWVHHKGAENAMFLD
jgi:hypothetical protein